MHGPDDDDLVAAARRGDRAAAAGLFERHWTRAWRTAFSLTRSEPAADDVAQDAFEHAFANLGTFNGRSTFATWLHRIVVNRSLNLLRDERRRAPYPAASAEATPVGEPSDRDLLAALDALPEERRTVVVLRYWLGFAPSEIAELLDLPAGTVHSRLARALQDLRSHMEAAS